MPLASSIRRASRAPAFSPTSTRRTELEELRAPTTSSRSQSAARRLTDSWRLVVA